MAYGYALECELAKLGIDCSIRGDNWSLTLTADRKSPVPAPPWMFKGNTGKLHKPYQKNSFDHIRATPERTAEIIAGYMKPPKWVEKPHAAIKEAKDASGS